jgi:hypothetical protein
MKPPKKKPLALWAVVCKDGYMGEVVGYVPTYITLSEATGESRSHDIEDGTCGPHRIVKLVEEVRK